MLDDTTISNHIRGLQVTDTCGIFLKIGSDKDLKHFLKMMNKKTFGEVAKDVFKSHYWFIFVKKPENIEINDGVLKLDSKIHLVVAKENSAELFEIYSIDGQNKIVTLMGNWQRKIGFGKYVSEPSYQDSCIETNSKFKSCFFIY